MLEGDERAALNAAMDRYADGDDPSFAAVYDLLAPRLHAFFLRHVRDPSRADDLLQQTLLQMHAGRRHYVRGSEVLSWAFAIGRNAMIDGHRRTRREVLFSTAEEGAAAIGDRIERESVPDGLAESRQMARRVDAELDRLPASQRDAFDLVRNDGLSVAEAAEVLGTTSTAIKIRVHRAYEAVRAVLVGDAPARPSKGEST